ncbi:flagellar export chaperone FlgN [Crassaminicella profunda]|uniref:flagellar export chaperone FlgN n=1 Tax=Crassaminicella profunda TaxID=1286698 RepID=UPI001CA728DB|nr:flagellar export chaperone FlgN [Crassaminicella profunda]QZY54289.1 flagellar protein FlgN [Crassaminicella profunda]
MEIKQMIDELINISKKKEKSLKELLVLTKKQEGFIKNGDLENLTVVIEQKQLIMEHINEIDISFLNHYNGLKKALNIASIEDIKIEKYPSLKELKLHIGNIMLLIKNMQKLDENNTIQLNIDFDKVKQDMKKLKTKKQTSKIASSYMKKYAGVQGVFIDHK